MRAVVQLPSVIVGVTVRLGSHLTQQTEPRTSRMNTATVVQAHPQCWRDALAEPFFASLKGASKTTTATRSKR
jgi:hypothetical protein